MKHSKRIAAGLTAAVIAAAGVTALAAQGSQEDPLVTLSYLNQVVTPALESKVTEAVKANEETLKARLDSAIDEYETKINDAISAAGGAGQFFSRELKKDESLTLAAGRELLLVSGSAKAVGSLMDTTAGKSVSAGSSLTAGHLYVTVSADSGLKAQGAVTAMSR